MSTELRLDEPGTLPRPGAIGRAARLLFAALCLFALWSVLEQVGDFLGSTSSALAQFVVAIAVAFWVFPHVVNIGFSKGWRRRPQVAIVLLLLVGAAASWIFYGSILGPPLGLIMFVWLMYVFGHLGVSFALATVLATPGCEMRAIPHVWTVMTGRTTKEHYCPGALDRIDKWEAARKSATT